MQAKVNKSEKIRKLFDAGLQIAQIARALGIRYQYAYNVVSQHVKVKEGSWASNDHRTVGNHGVHLLSGNSF